MPFELSLFIALGLALAPAVVSWWTGRAVLARVDDPVLPEILQERRRRLTTISCVATVGLTCLFNEAMPWTLFVLVLGLIVVAYPLRRALYGERCSLPSYLRYAILSTVGSYGLLLLIIFAPAVVASLSLGLFPEGGSRTIRVASWSGAVTAMIVALWQYHYARVWLALHRATPLREAIRPDLMSRLDKVVERASSALSRHPACYRFGAPGSYVMNAYAIPSPSHPAVALGDTLLATLDDEEIVAVFAHEIAHHEQFAKRARWRGRVLRALAVLLTAAIPIVLVAWFPGVAMLVAWSMSLVLVLRMGARNRMRRDAETASDVRAAELTGNPDAVISSLRKLHVYNRVPRRWPHAIERAMTHPSVARRIQAVREWGGLLEQDRPASAASFIVARSSTPGLVIAFDDDRAYWFEGVPAGTALALEALRLAASSYRAFRYGDLTELHVGVSDGDRFIEAADRDGRSWRATLAPNEIAAVQALLDRVDARLGKPRVTDMPAGRTTMRWLMLGLLIALMAAGQFGVALVPMLFVFVRPSLNSAVAATAAIALARVAMNVHTVPWSDPVHQVGLLTVIVITIVLIAQTVKRVRLELRRGNLHRMSRDAWLLVGVHGALLALIGAAIAPMLMDRPASLLSFPLALTAAAAMAGLGGALLTGPNRRWWTSGGIASVAGLVGGVLLSGEGWLFHRAPNVSWTSPRLTPAGSVRLSGTASSLLLSPQGNAFAVTQWQRSRAGNGGGVLYRIGRFADPTRTRTSDALKIVFLDDETVLALIAHGSDSLELRAERVAPDSLGNVTVLWRERLGSIEDAQLLIDRERHSWMLVGRGDGDWTFDVVSDTAAGMTPRVRHFGQHSSNEIGERLTNPLAAFGDAGVLWATFPRVGHGVASFTPILLALAASPRWELRGTDSSRERILVDMEGFPSCAIEVDRRGTLCIGRGPNGSSVWRATPNLALSLIAQLPPTFDVVHAESSNYIIAAERFGADIVVLDAMTHAGVRLTLPVAETKQPWSRWTADVAARDRYAVVLSEGRGGATVSRFVFR